MATKLSDLATVTPPDHEDKIPAKKEDLSIRATVEPYKVSNAYVILERQSGAKNRTSVNATIATATWVKMAPINAIFYDQAAGDGYFRSGSQDGYVIPDTVGGLHLVSAACEWDGNANGPGSEVGLRMILGQEVVFTYWGAWTENTSNRFNLDLYELAWFTAGQFLYWEVYQDTGVNQTLRFNFSIVSITRLFGEDRVQI